MKIIKCFVLFILLFSFSFPVFASTNTYTRTMDDLLVPDTVTVSQNNIASILNTPAVDASEKVYDFAGLLSSEEENTIFHSVEEFISDTSLDLGIVTISENNKLSARSYADDFYDYNFFGKDGVLFLVDMDTREIYMSTTGNAITLYDDYRVNKILDAIYEDFSLGNYEKGILKFVQILENYDTIGLPSNDDSQYVINDQGEVYKKFPYFILLGIPFIITAIVMGILIYKNKVVRTATSSREYLDQKSVKIKVLRDRLVSTHTSVTPIYHSSSGSGGSSHHSGSSGISHGGGGHRF